MSAPFDAMAAAYDGREAANPIVARMRRRSLARLRASFPAGARLLDVGAGTGAEALVLAAEGRSVVATDPSGAMLAMLTRKAMAAGLAIPTHQVPARHLQELVTQYGDTAFDGAYSSFGALNMEPDLAPVAGALSRLLRPRGTLVVSVMGRWPAAEIVLHLARLRPREAFRRRRPAATVRLPDGTWVPTYFPSLRGFLDQFGSHFEIEHREALPLVLPPPYTWPRLVHAPRLLAAMSRIDDLLARSPAMAGLGDHYLVVMRRRP